MVKKRGMFLFAVVLLAALLVMNSSSASARSDQYHLKLLAVQEGLKFIGSDADLYLELKEGSGRVFLETFPLTKMDTQVSTRFAKEVVCSHFHLDCDKYDFIFTIKAKSSILGGPSAGAAMAALTTIAVMNLDYDQDVAVTGTINSGGIIGPVGGVKEKLEAASAVGLKKVLIAKGTAKQKILRQERESSNISQEPGIRIEALENKSGKINLIEYGEGLNLSVIEVSNIEEVIFEMTGKKLNSENITVPENKEYDKIMKRLQESLCQRTTEIENEVKTEFTINKTIGKDLEKKQEQARNASEQKDYYSAASFCFSANIQLKNYYYQQKKFSPFKIGNLIEGLERNTLNLEKHLDAEKIETISDLQTYMIVKERINDVKDQIKIAREKEQSNDDQELKESYSLLAYAEERYSSAVSWSEFFEMAGKRFVVNQDLLQNSCEQKISESEERVQYAEIFLGEIYTKGIRDKIEEAKKALEDSEYGLCLITASQAKADSNALISSVGISEEVLPDYLQGKIKATERIISENSAEGVFPILGYSYYQYALSLQDEDKYTAMVYLEYALEMSDLQIYFPEEKKISWGMEMVLTSKNLLLLEGFSAGILFTLFLSLVIKFFRKKRR